MLKSFDVKVTRNSIVFSIIIQQILGAHCFVLIALSTCRHSKVTMTTRCISVISFSSVIKTYFKITFRLNSENSYHEHQNNIALDEQINLDSIDAIYFWNFFLGLIKNWLTNIRHSVCACIFRLISNGVHSASSCCQYLRNFIATEYHRCLRAYALNEFN